MAFTAHPSPMKSRPGLMLLFTLQTLQEISGRRMFSSSEESLFITWKAVRAVTIWMYCTFNDSESHWCREKVSVGDHYFCTHENRWERRPSL